MDATKDYLPQSHSSSSFTTLVIIYLCINLIGRGGGLYQTVCTITIYKKLLMLFLPLSKTQDGPKLYDHLMYGILTNLLRLASD